MRPLLSPRILQSFRTARIQTPLPLAKSFSTYRPMAQEYKLKGVSSLSLSPGSKQEVEVEGIENGKVLLVNTGGTTQALGSKCTHYGAPLAKGVLTNDGRITCPWHGGMYCSLRISA